MIAKETFCKNRSGGDIFAVEPVIGRLAVEATKAVDGSLNYVCDRERTRPRRDSFPDTVRKETD